MGNGEKKFLHSNTIKLVGQFKHKLTKGGKGVVSQEKGISKPGLDMNELDENPLRRRE